MQSDMKYCIVNTDMRMFGLKEGMDRWMDGKWLDLLHRQRSIAFKGI